MPKCKECGDNTKKNYYCQPCKRILLDKRQCMICGNKIANEILNSNRCNVHAGYNWFKCHTCGRDTPKRMKLIPDIRTYCSVECRKAMCMTTKKTKEEVAKEEQANNPYKAGIIKNCEAQTHKGCTGKMIVFKNNWTHCGLCVKPHTGRQVYLKTMNTYWLLCVVCYNAFVCCGLSTARCGLI